MVPGEPTPFSVNPACVSRASLQDPAAHFSLTLGSPSSSPTLYCIYSDLDKSDISRCQATASTPPPALHRCRLPGLTMADLSLFLSLLPSQSLILPPTLKVTRSYSNPTTQQTVPGCFFFSLNDFLHFHLNSLPFLHTARMSPFL